MFTADRQQQLRSTIERRLSSLYGAGEAPHLTDLIMTEIQSCPPNKDPLKKPRTWDQTTILLITYADSIRHADNRPMRSLRLFLERHLRNCISAVHLLPFFPYSSDDGFSVIDYLQVNPAFGNWKDVEEIGQSFDLMFDLVINHVSSEHLWFQQFIQGEAPGCNYFITPPVHADLTHVVRPRESALLTPVLTQTGERRVWTTFSADQVDINFANPRVLLEFIRILMAYIQRGARFIRLDAIAFLWKEWGTGCVNLPQTHELVRLLRDVVSAVAPDTVLLTETNVPHQQNISYFGNSDEAHMVYQFSLAPLLLHALYRGNSHYLTEWARSSGLAPPGCAFLNFTASHDGIGMRPLEGLLPQGEVDLLLKGMEQFGGLVSYRNNEDGSKSAYEINITYFDALKGTWMGGDSWQLARFLLAQTLMLGLRGIPALYLHSLLATENDHQGVARSGRARLINRHKWDYEELDALLSDSQTNQAIVFHEMRRRLSIRQQQPAFHPDAQQEILFLGEHLFGFWRRSLDGQQRILAVHNLTDQQRTLYLDGALDGQLPGCWVGLLTGEEVNERSTAALKLPPYHVLWLTPKESC